MAPLILLILGVSGVYGDSHTLWVYVTTVSTPGSGPFQFSSVGYVDDKKVLNYSSDTRQLLPEAEWMKKLDAEYWERYTKINRAKEPSYKHYAQTLMQRFNHTHGIHNYQHMYGCQLREDGSTEVYNQYGYDGTEIIYMDTKRWIFIPAKNEAQMTTQAWNRPERGMEDIWKNNLEKDCIGWLKKYISNGREDLEKRVRPEVKVWGRQQPDGVTRLQCLAYGFHPRAVDVKWVRNGEDHIPSDEASPILPHPDGTYQTRVSVEVPTREGDTYACHVEHSSLEETLTVPWDPSANGPSLTVISGAVIGGLAVPALLVITVIVYKKRKTNSTEYSSTNTSEASSD
ncbi:class I histocompatibility antigen, F10 alpha chain-like [Hyperolius riggenbachi]|uniref:class I histocompatibility antigen, F10 alpha chain-like n=1 Tax=Hyperolius riggenbachi TaxID=752182 RepID=UPI0035A32964